VEGDAVESGRAAPASHAAATEFLAEIVNFDC